MSHEAEQVMGSPTRNYSVVLTKKTSEWECEIVIRGNVDTVPGTCACFTIHQHFLATLLTKHGRSLSGSLDLRERSDVGRRSSK